MSQKESGNLITFLVGLMSGAVVGTVIGLLSAPKAGDNTREELSFKAKELKDTAKNKIVGVKEFGKDSIEKVKNSLRDKAHKLSVKLDELAKQGSDVLIQDEVN